MNINRYMKKMNVYKKQKKNKKIFVYSNEINQTNWTGQKDR